jgi:hypothetical protein
MSWRNVPFVKEAMLLAAAFLFVVPQVLAGDKEHAANQPTTRSHLASAPVARAVSRAVAISVVVTMPVQPAKEPYYVNLRGPDGQVRRFPVEGGRAAIQYRQVVLHPGEMLTIHWIPAK